MHFIDACKYLSLGVLLRALLIIFGIFQDLNYRVSYTDVDYFVLRDAAQKLIFAPTSSFGPFLRETFRYTPILAYILIPDILLDINFFGKLIFCATDLLLAHILQVNGAGRLETNVFWLFNPMVFIVSTRGNMESVVCFTVLLMLMLLQRERYYLSGLVFGLSVHLKLYPIIFAWPIYCWVVSKEAIKGNSSYIWIPKKFFKFSLPAASVFVALSVAFYIQYLYIVLFVLL
jgi:GPI mannosyltransferase 1 subunit M